MLGLTADGVVGGGDGRQHHVTELVGGHIRPQVGLQLLLEAGHGDGAGHPAAVGAAHTVADHRGVATAHRERRIGVLVLAAHQTGIGNAPRFHDRLLLPCSSIALRRSWPQEASMSPPRLRRTVAVIP